VPLIEKKESQKNSEKDLKFKNQIQIPKKKEKEANISMSFPRFLGSQTEKKEKRNLGTQI
jgi:hypothetical protein